MVYQGYPAELVEYKSPTRTTLGSREIKKSWRRRFTITPQYAVRSTDRNTTIDKITRDANTAMESRMRKVRGLNETGTNLVQKLKRKSTPIGETEKS